MILDNIKNLSIRNKMIATFLAYSLLIFFIIYFIIFPRVKFIRENGREIIERRVFLEEQYIRARNFKENNEEMKLVDADIQKLDEVFVNYDNDLQFIETLEKIAIDNNVNQKISLGAIKNEEISEFEKITLEISANGNFLNIMNYLIDLETLNYYINISSLDIFESKVDIERGPGEEGPSSSSNVSCKITADTYWK